MPRKAKAEQPAKKETKASLIRAYKADHPDQGPTAIAQSLTAQGGTRLGGNGQHHA